MNSKEKFFEYTQALQLEDQTIHFRTVLPRKEKTLMALEMAEAGQVFDDELGIVYETYTAELVLMVLMMRYYTDFDLSEFDGEEGWYQLHDILESHGALEHLYGFLVTDIAKVQRIYETLKTSASKSFEHTHSLNFLARKSFGSLLSTEDITETIAKASDVNNTMVDLMDAFVKLQSPKNLAHDNLLQFGKRNRGDT